MQKKLIVPSYVNCLGLRLASIMALWILPKSVSIDARAQEVSFSSSITLIPTLCNWMNNFSNSSGHSSRVFSNVICLTECLMMSLRSMIKYMRSPSEHSPSGKYFSTKFKSANLPSFKLADSCCHPLKIAQSRHFKRVSAVAIGSVNNEAV